jgi:3-methyladenine DNA glycosylase AlkC
MRVRLGGERRIDLARECGYRDGSASTQILKRLERAALSDSAIRKRFSALKAEHASRLSSVRSRFRCPREFKVLKLTPLYV